MGALNAGRAAVDSLRSAIPEHRAESRTPVNLNEAMRDVLDLTTTRMLGRDQRALATAGGDAFGQRLSEPRALNAQGDHR